MTIQSDAVQAVSAEYRARGYDVEVEPGAAAVPEFLLGFKPDLVARRPGDNVIIEIKVGTRTAEGELRREHFESLIHAQPLRNPLVHGLASAVDLQPDSLAAIAEAILGELKGSA